MKLKVGADPELFVKKEAVFLSAHELIPGTKQEPHPVEDGAVQVDGLALEFNINPAESQAQFVHNIESVLQQLRAMVPEDYQFAIEPVARFSADHMKSLPKNVIELGCDPDFNAYTGRINRSPKAPVRMRTAAGHVHVGWTEEADVTSNRHFHACCALVKAMDTTLGVPSKVLDEQGNERRKLYGQAGAFRPKSYGVEYRTLGNFWITRPEWMEWVYDTTIKTVKALVSGYDFPRFSNYINADDWESRHYQPHIENLHEVYKAIGAKLPDEVVERWHNA